MHALISQCMVVGDGRPFIGVLITIDPEAFGPWKARHGKPADATVADLRDDPDLLAEVQEAVDDANKAVSRAEAIKKFRILDVGLHPGGRPPVGQARHQAQRPGQGVRERDRRALLLAHPRCSVCQVRIWAHSCRPRCALGTAGWMAAAGGMAAAVAAGAPRRER